MRQVKISSSIDHELKPPTELQLAGGSGLASLRREYRLFFGPLPGSFEGGSLRGGLSDFGSLSDFWGGRDFSSLRQV